MKLCCTILPTHNNHFLRPKITFGNSAPRGTAFKSESRLVYKKLLNAVFVTYLLGEWCLEIKTLTCTCSSNKENTFGFVKSEGWSNVGE